MHLAYIAAFIGLLLQCTSFLGSGHEVPVVLTQLVVIFYRGLPVSAAIMARDGHATGGITPVGVLGPQLVDRRHDEQRSGQIDDRVRERPQVGVRRGAGVVADAPQLRIRSVSRASTICLSYVIPRNESPAGQI